MHPLLSFLGRLLLSSFLFGELYDLPAFLQSLVSLHYFIPSSGLYCLLLPSLCSWLLVFFFLNEVICISRY
ncbi:hypothetical protein PAHAL_1G089000 [Panicum hallii]|uniref:Uncharacterized protein n=1 Tax=Panicum hallii TaxID=206008 RepID=A0A2T8KUJ6_9POAL|nr:hypothetical protein PAHAL_1G089000 [Panicum hallii]